MKLKGMMLTGAAALAIMGATVAPGVLAAKLKPRYRALLEER